VLSLGPGVRIFVSVEPVDMRGSFDALAGAVRRMGLDPVDGHLYLFFNRRRRLCKIVCLYSKRLLCGGPHESRYAKRDVLRGGPRALLGTASRRTSHYA
jgi:transposase